MRRQPWFEMHDSPWFPGYLRDLVTEALETIWNQNGTYRPIAGRLRDALRRAQPEQVVDLCSGGGGPWTGLYAEVAGGRRLDLRLTDLHPNARLLERAAADGNGIRAHAAPVDATRVPATLRGFRTMFSSFHHFDPEQARAILADAFRQRQGIAVFDAARPTAKTILAVTGVPVLAVWAALTARPFRWSRFFWSCIVPAVPLVLWVDGVLSCLRSYTEQDLQELISGLSAPDYRWETGEERRRIVSIQYLVGIPVRGRK